jgi:putative SOS response-associated peptidase YedK
VYKAEPIEKLFAAYDTLSKNDPKHFKPLAPQVYIKYWAPVVFMKERKRVIRPMRYRFRPSWAEEDLPSKYSLNTARLDTLTSSKIWASAFTKHHGIIAIESFLEWVTDPKDKKRKLVSFRPKDRDFMCCPVIFAEAIDGSVSFALITDDPTPEILKAGYDRCPVYLKEEHINDWLQPEGKTKEALLDLLKDQNSAYFECKVLRDKEKD